MKRCASQCVICFNENKAVLRECETCKTVFCKKDYNWHKYKLCSRDAKVRKRNAIKLLASGFKISNERQLEAYIGIRTYGWGRGNFWIGGKTCSFCENDYDFVDGFKFCGYQSCNECLGWCYVSECTVRECFYKMQAHFIVLSKAFPKDLRKHMWENYVREMMFGNGGCPH